MQSVLPNSSSSSRSPWRNPTTDDSDIDFADVFGGPPRRRSLLHDVMRHSFSETAASSSSSSSSGDGGSGGGALISRRTLWRGESDEKPVFGDEPANRRRFTTDDFFNDIFRGNETSIGSPRKRSEIDPFGSNPGFRVMSPTIAEPYGTSLPVQFSLPAKQIKVTEIPTFGSLSRSLTKNRDTPSSSVLSRSSSHNNLRNGFSPKPVSSNVSEVPGRSRHFHFSIYKWPNKGVPTVLWGGSRLKEMARAEDDEGITLQHSIPSSDSRSTLGEKVGKGEEESSSQSYNVQTEPVLLSEPPFSGVTEARDAKTKKPLHSLFADNDYGDDEQGEDVLAGEERKKDKSKGKTVRHSYGDSRSKKKPQGRRSSLDSGKPDKSSFPSSSSNPREVRRDGVQGKVREFIKVFNQGGAVVKEEESLRHSSRWRTKENTMGIDVNEAAKSSNEPQKPSSNSPATEKNSKVQNMENTTHGGSRQEQSTAHNVQEDTEEPFDLNFQVREITQDENKPEYTGDDVEEIQVIDAKILKWSQGKDRNIRSLLSTLQYILWPESGWKAAPLMNLIEANAVRRSYQKALLILHPDKLQQKGASVNQKYIAEKVFELLQESWEFFNSVGPI